MSERGARRARVRALPPTFTAARARDAGIGSRDLRHLADSGDVDELSRGVYRRSDAPESAYLDLLAVAARCPDGVVCLESALSLHDLIDDLPGEVHLAVARGHHAPHITYPVVDVHRFDDVTFEIGVEWFEAAPGEHVRVYSPARSVVDAMRLRHRVGDGLALHALRRYLRRTGQRGVPELLRLARSFRVEGPVRFAVEAVLA
ncbi:type IV toxin-antitoxin system AbiEi family antitoxin domain-containing protein [Catellatospora citrea]|uniref:AbiEi antitoxin N-terminal domain-containing protein n=1 Tax=Catellatospora citrea TaxID=53366 RepID=A0A8J3K738_9ACTN|nr:type IV toxin-antitoxin system AbiEi family antitoxin domain-containing protein [Catellatospora citrea]RKE07187.1 hypothetical protein C8E86_2012 [Catellatospora citrea]GIF95339.1 hypothetical protein Cci01nite_04330 [Catellatospora citrea]